MCRAENVKPIGTNWILLSGHQAKKEKVKLPQQTTISQTAFSKPALSQNMAQNTVPQSTSIHYDIERWLEPKTSAVQNSNKAIPQTAVSQTTVSQTTQSENPKKRTRAKELAEISKNKRLQFEKEKDLKIEHLIPDIDEDLLAAANAGLLAIDFRTVERGVEGRDIAMKIATHYRQQGYYACLANMNNDPDKCSQVRISFPAVE